MNDATLWWITLAAGVVVVVVVAVLLAAIAATAQRIRSTLDAIWIAGQSVANNTAHLDLLRRINLGVAAATERIGRSDEQARPFDAAEGKR